MPNLSFTSLSIQKKHNIAWTMKPILQQECIPVGCVPATQWPYPGGGGGGVHPKRNFGEKILEKKFDLKKYLN